MRWFGVCHGMGFMSYPSITVRVVTPSVSDSTRIAFLGVAPSVSSDFLSPSLHAYTSSLDIAICHPPPRVFLLVDLLLSFCTLLVAFVLFVRSSFGIAVTIHTEICALPGAFLRIFSYFFDALFLLTV